MSKKYCMIFCVNEKDPLFSWANWIKRSRHIDIKVLSYSKEVYFNFYLETMGGFIEKYFCSSGKWKNIRKYFMKKGFGEYEYYWFPDPDLTISFDDILKYFIFIDEHRIDLSQPSLTSDSFASHAFMKNDKNSIMRESAFVEVMCPCFSKYALKELLWTFNLSYSGYGLDILWAKYFRTYIVDLFQVKHFRKQNFHKRAREHGFPDPNDELNYILKNFNLKLER